MTPINDLDLIAIRHVIVTLMDISRRPRSKESTGAIRVTAFAQNAQDSQNTRIFCESVASICDSIGAWIRQVTALQMTSRR
jgi:hypothetical protein